MSDIPDEATGENELAPNEIMSLFELLEAVPCLRRFFSGPRSLNDDEEVE